jgi:hypothetical protein
MHFARLIVLAAEGLSDEPLSHLLALLLGGGVPGAGALGVVVWYTRSRLRQLDRLRAAERRASRVEQTLKIVLDQVVAEQNRQSRNMHNLRGWCMHIGFGKEPSTPPDWEPGQISMPKLPNEALDESETEE